MHAFWIVVLLATLMVACGRGSTPAESTTLTPMREPTPPVARSRAFADSENPTASERHMIHPRQAHTSTLLNDGRLLIAGGSDFIGPIPLAEAYNPATDMWTSVEAMLVSRAFHSATLLDDGRVLVVGGIGEISNIDSAELYEPATNRWSLTGRMVLPRGDHTATLLNDGRVLVAGGLTSEVEGEHLNSVELYDPSTGQWSPTGGMAHPRGGHAAALLEDGRVLVAGGSAGTLTGIYRSAEVYDPVTGSWSPAGSMTVQRATHTATLLPDGRILVTGGNLEEVDAETYDPSTGIWELAGSMEAVRQGHVATMLPDGRVLVTGGGPSQALAEIYDPSDSSWFPAGKMEFGRVDHTATLLRDGRVAVAGGVATNAPVQNVEIYDSASGRWLIETFAGAWTTARSMSRPRELHTATLLPSGEVLVAGGRATTAGAPMFLESAEVYAPSSGTWSSTGRMSEARAGHAAVLMRDGLVLVTGGLVLTSSGAEGSALIYLASVEIYDPATRTWSPVESMTEQRWGHSATLLEDGRVMVAGGDNGQRVATAELYDPSTGKWSSTGSMEHPRGDHAATMIEGGKVLVAGGAGDSAELYDPSTGEWSSVGAISRRVGKPGAALLEDGSVFVMGGRIPGGAETGENVPAEELYDPASRTWYRTSGYPDMNMVTRRIGPSVTMLRNGTALVLGGSSELTLAVLYDPANDEWSPAGNMIDSRREHTATELEDGGVLIVGGNGRNRTTLDSVELYKP